MKICPNCHEEVENNFEVCWNCNYSFSENKIIDFQNPTDDNLLKINCLRCKVPMKFAGKYNFHEGSNLGVFGNLFELFVNREAFDLYICPECGKIEFFSPKN